MSGRGYTTKVSAEDHFLASVGGGKIPGLTHNNWNAYDPTASTTDYLPLTEWQNSAYTFPSDSGEAMTIVSTVAGDLGKVMVFGLDQNFMRKEQIVTLNGTTPVALDGLWTRINEIIGVDAFTGNVSIGTYCTAYPEYQQSLSGVYSSPADERTYFIGVSANVVKVSGGSDSYADLRLRYRVVGGTFKISFFVGLATPGSSAHVTPNFIPEAVPGPADFVWRAKATAANTAVYCRTGLLFEKV